MARPKAAPDPLTAEAHAEALLFSSLAGAEYLFDSATSTVHPWPWQVRGKAVDALYEADDEALEATAALHGASPGVASYLAAWRRHAGAFGKPICSKGAPSLVLPDTFPAGNFFFGTSPQGERASKKTLVKKAPAIRFHEPSMLCNLMLVVTDNCNLRCGYCLLDGNAGYKPLRPKQMSPVTALRAVDEFIRLNDTPAHRGMHKRKINVAFFGGEPLLRGDLIRQVVDYARAQEKPGCGYWIDFALTSNLTLLTDEMAGFFVSRNVGLQVSIDGPSEIHDRYRVTARGGGSFAAVYRNLQKLRSLSSAYFDERVRAVITFNGLSDLDAIYRFFSGGDPVIPRISFIGGIRNLKTSAFHQKHPYDQNLFHERYMALWDVYLEKKKSGAPVVQGDFLYHLFEEPLLSIYKRVMTVGARARSTYTGTCQPGRRIAVSTDGRYHVCERINEEFPLGDVERGFDKDACALLMERYYASLPACEKCWAAPLCITCFAHNCQESEFRFGERCADLRAELAFRLRLLFTLLEAVPRPFPEDEILAEMVPVVS